MQFFSKKVIQKYDIYKLTNTDIWGELLFQKTKSYKTVNKLFNAFILKRQNRYRSVLTNKIVFFNGYKINKQSKSLLRRLVIFRNYLFFKKSNKQRYSSYNEQFRKFFGQNRTDNIVNTKRALQFRIRKTLFYQLPLFPTFLSRNTKVFMLKKAYNSIIFAYLKKAFTMWFLNRKTYNLKYHFNMYSQDSLFLKNISKLYRMLRIRRLRKFVTKRNPKSLFVIHESKHPEQSLKFAFKRKQKFKNFDQYIASWINYYGVSLGDKTFINFFSLFKNNELNLITTLWRTNWFHSYYFIKNLVNHGGVIVNGRPIENYSFRLQPGDHVIIEDNYKNMIFQFTNIINKRKNRLKFSDTIYRKYTSRLKVSGLFWKKKNYMKNFIFRNIIVGPPGYMELSNKLLCYIILHEPKKTEITLPFWFIF